MPTATYKFPDGRKARIDYETPEQLQDAVAHLENAGRGQIVAPQGVAANLNANAIRIPTPAEELNSAGKMAVGLGRGVYDIGQALSQSARHALPENLGRAGEYDQQIANEAKLYDQGLGGSWEAGVGRMAVNLAPAIPSGLAAGNAARTLAMSRGITAPVPLAVLEGMAGGLATTATQPVLEGDFAQGKAQQAVTSSLLGGTFSGALSATGRGIEEVANIPVNAANAMARQIQQPGQGVVSRVVSGGVKPSEVQRGADLFARLGIDATPAQISGSRAGTMVENLSRQSVFTADDALRGDLKRSAQLINAVKRTAKSISGSQAVDPASVGTQVQKLTTDAVSKIAAMRSTWGRRAYGQIDRAANGQKIVGTQNLRNEIGAILKEYEGVTGADAQKVVSQVRKWIDTQDEILRLGDRGRVSAGTALRQLQTYAKGARGEGNIFADLEGRGVDRALSARLQSAMMRDLDEAAANNGRGNLGVMIRRANEGWRKFSSELDAIEGSILGSVVGDDFAGEISGVAFNKVAPERVFQRLVTAQPSEIAVAKSYLTRFNPQVWQDFQKARLLAALDAARISPATAGPRAIPMDPARFIDELTGGAGARGKLGMDRLKAIYGDSPAWPAIRDLLNASRRMGDSFGRNYSNTAVAQQAMSAMDKLSQIAGGAIRQGVGTAATIAGLKQYTQQAMNGAPAQLYQLPARAGLARKVAATGLPAVVPLLPEEQQ
jgi:hypothetical protein